MKDEETDLRGHLVDNSGPEVSSDMERRRIQLEEDLAWMVPATISTRSHGRCNVFLVAPHGYPGNDDNVEKLTHRLADELECYAVVNHQKYMRPKRDENGRLLENPDLNSCVMDLNSLEDAPQCADFIEPLLEYVNVIQEKYPGKSPIVFFIHGMKDTDAEATEKGMKIEIGAASKQLDPWDDETATASEELVVELISRLTDEVGQANYPGRFTGSECMPTYFRKNLKYPVNSIQMEFGWTGIRDTKENIERTAMKVASVIGGLPGFVSLDGNPKEAEIVIDPEFLALIPPLAAEEREQLESNLLRDGCRDPLVVWSHEGKHILLDGHHRYEICKKHWIPIAGPSKVKLENRDDAIMWIIQNQMGRRNINDFVRGELALRLAPILRARGKANQSAARRVDTSSGVLAKSPKANTPVNTRKEMAKAASVGDNTMQKIMDLDRNAPEELKQQLRSGDISINAAHKNLRQKQQKETDALHASNAQTTGEAKQDNLEDEAKKPTVVTELYDVILVNAPWESSEVSVEQLAELPIPALSRKDSILWLRSTNSRMPEAYKLLAKWNFQPVDVLTWLKPEATPGEWLHNQTEHYIMAVRGEPTVNRDQTCCTALSAAEMSDSRKPVGFYQLIERMYAGERRLEVYPDGHPEGWEEWTPA